MKPVILTAIVAAALLLAIGVTVGWAATREDDDLRMPMTNGGTMGMMGMGSMHDARDAGEMFRQCTELMRSMQSMHQRGGMMR